MTVQDDVASKSWISSSDINRTCTWKGLIFFKLENVSLDFLCNLLNRCQPWCIQVVVGAGFDYWHPKSRSFGTWLSDEMSQHALLRSREEPWVGWSTLNRRRHEGKKGEGKGQWPMAMIFWVEGTIHVVTTSCMTMKKLAYPASPPLTYHQLEFQFESRSRGLLKTTASSLELTVTAEIFRKSSWTKQFSSALDVSKTMFNWTPIGSTGWWFQIFFMFIPI